MTAEQASTTAAIDAIRVAIGEDAYVFLDDDADHFVAEAFLIAIAGALLQSFAKGFTERARERSETWGRDVADWLGDRIELVLDRVGDDKPAAPIDTAAAEALPILEEARVAAAGSRPAQIESYAAASEAALAKALRERQLTAAEAARVAAEVREAGLQAIQGV